MLLVAECFRRMHRLQTSLHRCKVVLVPWTSVALFWLCCRWWPGTAVPRRLSCFEASLIRKPFHVAELDAQGDVVEAALVGAMKYCWLDCLSMHAPAKWCLKIQVTSTNCLDICPVCTGKKRSLAVVCRTSKLCGVAFGWYFFLGSCFLGLLHKLRIMAGL